MDNLNLEELFNDKRGYEVGMFQLLESILGRAILNATYLEEVLGQLLEVKQLLEEGTVDHDKVDDQLDELNRHIYDDANAKLKQLIASLHLEHGGDEAG